MRSPSDHAGHAAEIAATTDEHDLFTRVRERASSVATREAQTLSLRLDVRTRHDVERRHVQDQRGMSESSAARRCPPERHPPRIDARLAASMGQCRAQVGTLRLHVDDLPRGSTLSPRS